MNYVSQVIAFTNTIFQGFYKFKCVRFALFSFVYYVANIYVVQIKKNQKAIWFMVLNATFNNNSVIS
jgi:hypothetical protein